MSNNGSKEEERTKKCPLLREWCIKESCTLWIEIRQVKVGSLGVPTTITEGMCCLPALCMIVSPQMHPQNIKLPPIQLKG